MVTVDKIKEAAKRLEGVIKPTVCEINQNLSKIYEANIFLKREDLQIVRSYKIRGAYNNIVSRPKSEIQRGVVCASAGNHAQGFSLSCKLLGVMGHCFMPVTTPKQKINQVKMFGGENIEIILDGDTFDDSNKIALEYAKSKNLPFIHPFDNESTVCGQGTVGLEILESMQGNFPDYVFAPIGGGGLMAGVGSYIHAISPKTKLIGVEPLGAPSMKTSIDNNIITTLDTIDKFVDGAAVKRVGDVTFAICKDILSDIVLVPEGKVCTTILKMYNEEAIVLEPAGALSLAALDYYKDEIKGKTIVCIVSGSNNDIDRMAEIKERSLVFEGLKRYFIVVFPQRPGALKAFVDTVLGTNDDITRFEYLKKTSKEFGSAIVGIEFKSKDDYEPLLERMVNLGFKYLTVNDAPVLFDYLI